MLGRYDRFSIRTLKITNEILLAISKSYLLDLIPSLMLTKETMVLLRHPTFCWRAVMSRSSIQTELAI